MDELKKEPIVADEITKSEVIEVSNEVVTEITKSVAKELGDVVKDQVNKAFEAREQIIDKGIGSVKKDIVSADFESMGKELRFIKMLKAYRTGDKDALKGLSDFENAQQKANGYQQTGVSADGGYLVPPADFIADVIRLEEQYGVARRNAKIYEVNSNSVTMNTKSTGVTMYETGEGVVKTGTKMTFGQVTVTLRKYAAIATLTDEITEDSAVQIYNELVTDFAREKARIEDVLVFTDTTTGILKVAGTAAVTVGSSIASITFDHLNSAIYKVPTDSMTGGKFYFHRSLLGTLQKIKDVTSGQYIWQPGVNGSVTGTIWGFPYELTEVLPSLSQDANNKAFIVFGDLKYTTLVSKRGLQMTNLVEGTVHGSDGSALNLAEQDMTALRVVSRMNNKVVNPTAFCIIGTGTVS